MTLMEFNHTCPNTGNPVASPDLPTFADAPLLADATGGAGAPPPSEPAGIDFGLRLRPFELAELFALNIKPRGMVLDPVIPEKGLVMLYAARGTGKTHVALGIAYAVATGASFLKWRAPRARRVVVVGGEMPAGAVRGSLAWISGGEAPAARTATP